jgi:thioesterase domain-containing protein
MRKAFPQASSEAVSARDKGDECYLLLNRIAQFDGALERLETAMPEPIKQAVARRREPGPGHLLAMTKRIVSQIASLARYQPEGRPGIAVEDLRAASRGEPESADEWESFTSGTVRRYVLDGDHWSILTEPKVSKLAKAINQTLSI